MTPDDAAGLVAARFLDGAPHALGHGRTDEPGPEQICDEVAESGLRGRGGAGVPTEVQWRTVLTVGIREGFIYIRSEYPDAVVRMRGAGAYGCGEEAGAYVCGEETAMLESLEGTRGAVRRKPPLPAIAGLFGKPTPFNDPLALGRPTAPSTPVSLLKLRDTAQAAP